MGYLENIYQFARLLQISKGYLSSKHLCNKLDISPATLSRWIDRLRNDFGAPIIYDRRYGGYKLNPTGEKWELPGTWFTGDEIAVLTGLLETFHELHGGILDEAISDLRSRLESILRANHISPSKWHNRIRILPMNIRTLPSGILKAVSEGVLFDKRLHFTYHSPTEGSTTRTVSPQTLIRYRDNWYLDAVCHLRRDLRTFAMNRIHNLKVLKDKAIRESQHKLNQHFDPAYGLFAGPATNTAHLRFRDLAAHRAAEEIWHPRQEACWADEACFELRFPYGDSRELLGEILRYGSHAEVLEPESLRAAVKQQLKAALEKYEDKGLIGVEDR